MKRLLSSLVFALMALQAGPAAAVACTVPPASETLAAEVLARANSARARAGLPALLPSGELAGAALAHACSMAGRGFFSHQGADGSSVRDRVRGQGYRSCIVAENIAAGQPTAEAVMASWLNSRGHRRNILDRRVHHIGLGAALPPGGGTLRWVMVLAAPC